MSAIELQYLTVDDQEDEYQDIVDSEFYDIHVSALTKEGLHKKSEIAVELARRDIKIADLQRRNEELEKAVKKAARVMSAEDMTKQSLIDALELCRSALARNQEVGL